MKFTLFLYFNFLTTPMAIWQFSWENEISWFFRNWTAHLC